MPYLGPVIGATPALLLALPDGCFVLAVLITAAQELKPLVKGVPRAHSVPTVMQLLVREFAPASAAWLTTLLNSGFAEQSLRWPSGAFTLGTEMPSAPPLLTDRQMQVGDLAVQGLGNKQIADRLGLTPAQVQGPSGSSTAVRASAPAGS